LGFETGSGTYTLAGGSVRVGTATMVGKGGTGVLTLDGGTFATSMLEVPSRFPLDIGHGTLTMNGGGALDAGTIELGSDGSILVGNTFTSSLLKFDSFNVVGGVFDNATIGPINVGVAGRPAQVNLGSGTFATTVLNVGHGGVGTFDQSGGTTRTGLAIFLSLGSAAGGEGTYRFSGGSMTYGTVRVGDAAGAAGTFEQLAGRIAPGTVTLAANSGASGTYLLSGGTFAATRLLINEGGTFVYDAGKFNVATMTMSGGKFSFTSGGDKVARTNSLSMNPAAAQLDVADNAMIVDYPHGGPNPVGNIVSLIDSGYAGGAWTGNGITSSIAAAMLGDRAVGYALSSEIFSSFPALFFGESVDSSVVLIRLTLPGDADLSEKVDINDFARLAANFNQTGRWPQGDFNYDLSVSISDFALLAANFNQGIVTGVPRHGSVPESSTWLAVLALAAALKSLPRGSRLS
jgi:hypothetical protein